MKLLSLNTHSLREAQYEEKLETFLGFVLREGPDIIALQEVMQTADGPVSREDAGMMALPDGKIALREDNHALRIARALMERGADISWAWLPVKRGYDRYDEGVAILSLKGKIHAMDTCAISRIQDYQNWRSRKVLGAQIGRDWFYSVHTGWWQDDQEPFLHQWQVLNEHLRDKRRRNRVWLMGDFNAPDHLRDQAYDHIIRDGWKDCYHMARERQGKDTMRHGIDGWRDASGNSGMRIDYILCSEDVPVRKYRVVFDGVHEPMISDHFGIMAQIPDMWREI